MVPLSLGTPHSRKIVETATWKSQKMVLDMHVLSLSNVAIYIPSIYTSQFGYMVIYGHIWLYMLNNGSYMVNICFMILSLYLILFGSAHIVTG